MVSVAKTAWVISGNASGFSAAVTQAERDAQKLTLSLQSQLNRVNLVGRSFDTYQLALAGASREAVAQVEQLQRQVQEAEAYQQAVARGAAITQQLMTAEERHSHSLAELNSLLKQNIITQQTYDRAIAAANASFTRTTANMQQMSSGAGKATFAIQQLAFGAQDAATVYGTSGFAGAVRASSNNVIQFASLLGPLYGTIAALAGTGIALAVDAWDKHNRKLKENIDTIDTFSRSLKFLDEGLAALTRFRDEDTFLSSLEQYHTQIISNNKQLSKTNDILDTQRAKLRRLNRGPGALASHEISALINPGQDEEMYEKTLEKLKRRKDKFDKDNSRTESRQTQEMIDAAEKVRTTQERKSEITASTKSLKENETNLERRLKEEEATKFANAQAKKRQQDIEEASKAAEDRNKRVLALEKGLRAARNPQSAEVDRIKDELKARQKEINELFPQGGDQRDRLLQEAADAAELQSKRLRESQKTSHIFAGAVDQGSKEAFSAAVEHKFGNLAKPLDPQLEKQLEELRLLVKETRAVKDAVKNDKPPVFRITG